jgi:hypothetical protein
MNSRRRISKIFVTSQNNLARLNGPVCDPFHIEEGRKAAFGAGICCTCSGGFYVGEQALTFSQGQEPEPTDPPLRRVRATHFIHASSGVSS